MACQFATVTSQADIDEGTFPPCVNLLDIVNASGVLNVTIPTLGAIDDAPVSIYVYDSPELLELQFPLSFYLQSLKLQDATHLTTVSMPSIKTKQFVILHQNPNSKVIQPLLQVAIRGAHSLESITLNTTSIGYLTVNDSTIFDGFEDITYVYSMDGGTCITPNVESVYDLSISENDDCFVSSKLAQLSTVNNLTIEHPSYPLTITSLQVNETLVVGPSITGSGAADSGREPVDLTYISTVGKDVDITSNSDFAFDLSKLATIGAELAITNNTNCTFDISRLEEVGNLSLTDNIDTVLPLFPNLAKAGNILLRGIIDTSPGPNIFPALSLVSGTVTIEAWNDDFNCSKLVSQQRDSLIHNLVCNGTDNGADTSAMRSSALTKGAQAGIGVGVGIFVLALAAGTWMLLRLQRQRRVLAERNQTQSSQQDVAKPATQPTLPEMSGEGIIQEKPDDPLVELPVVPPELVGNQIHELDATPTQGRIKE
ncbi:hypothetical protein F5Y10DRAFT_228738 [Nemania abortiva]|nr:hypothetical protein F5Y10DRAFT_228738 [Nemania abortiva]